MNLIHVNQIDPIGLSGYVQNVASGFAYPLIIGESGMLVNLITGASGVLYNQITGISGAITLTAQNLSGFVSLTFNVPVNSGAYNVSFGQILTTIPNLVPHLYCSGGGDSILATLSTKTLSGCSFNFSDFIPNNNYYLDLIVKT